MTSSGQNVAQRTQARHTRAIIAGMSIAAIAGHLFLRFGVRMTATIGGIPVHELPLILCLLAGGLPLLAELAIKLHRRDFGSDLLAGLSIFTSAVLGEYLAGCLVVLMLSGGQALEDFAIRSASSVLEALAARMPSRAHRKRNDELAEVTLDEVTTGDLLLVFPHEICPVDGTVVDGRGVMDESYLTGEPYMISKTPGSQVLSGAINGESALTIRADKLAQDSRYSKIMEVMRASEQRRPRLRRLADTLGAFYTPLAVTIALGAWIASGEARRFLAVLVVATPCPLLIAIPVALIGSISLAARRGIIIKDPAVLETIDTCRTAIFDKTGTLTQGRPRLETVIPSSGFAQSEVLTLVASLERYSKHPLATAVLEAARGAGTTLVEASSIAERPGEGMKGTVAGHSIQITSRQRLLAQQPALEGQLPPVTGGLECVVLFDDHYAATFRFRDLPRSEGASFIGHLSPSHHFDRVMLVSGDRESEVQDVARRVGISEIYFGQSPEQKVDLVRSATRRGKSVFLGDGINDAPALATATVGIAFGSSSDITAEAAGAVIMDSSLQKVDELLHISRRMRSIALESAVGGIALSLLAMLVAAAGYLPPVAGAIVQEVIDVTAVANALRVAIPPRSLSDY
jgi:heavy metal translocating P-type ATPase